MQPRAAARTIACVLMLCSCSSGSNGKNPNPDRPPAPTFQPDATLSPSMSTVAGVNGGPARAVGSVQGPSGKKTDLVQDELLVVTDQKSKVDALAGRWKGTIVSDAGFDVVGTTAFRMYLVRIDPSGVDVSGFGGKLQSIDPLARGAHTVSSDRITQLLAVAAQETLADPSLSVGINPLLVSQGIWEGTATEGAAAASTSQDPYTVSADPFTWPHMVLHGVPAAWQALQEAGKLGNRVKVLILDGGFVKSADIPPSLVMMPSDGWGKQNPAVCTNNNPCPWHGTETLSTLAGVLDNGFGGAGVAAPVADVIAVPSPSPDVFQYVGYAMQVLGGIAEGAQVINISATTSVTGALGFTIKPLDNIITLLRGKTFGPVQIRFGPGALVFAAAGNTGDDVDNEDCFGGCWETDVYLPCELDDAVCVGGLKYGSRLAHPSSNWGRNQRRRGNGSDAWTSQDNSVDLYAPFTVVVGPDADGSGNVQGSGGRFADGTSFSSPFAAGVAALVWAADPTLNADQVFQILLDTADSTPGGDGLVINALAAVKKALGTENHPPILRITTPANGASVPIGVPGGTFIGDAKDLEDANACCQISWSSDQEGALGNGATLTHAFSKVGAQVITATAKDSQGATATAQVHVTVSDIPVLASITSPTASDVIYQGRNVQVVGKAFQNLSDLCQSQSSTIAWSSSDASDGFIGPGCIQTYFAGSTGSRTLTFTARDQYGEQGSASIVIDVQPAPAAPTITITKPVSPASAQFGSVVTLQAFPQGGVAPLGYQWTWQSANTGCTEQNIPVTAQAPSPPYINATWDTSTQPSNGCGSGIGTLRVHVTDSLNQTGVSQNVTLDLFVIN
jgi:serine protease